MLADVIDVLADPIDVTALRGAEDYSRLVSESGHSYDVARQGYVTLAGGAGLKFKGDDPEMVSSRETFLASGHFSPFVEAITESVHDALDDAHVPDDAQPALCEIGAGTGYYLSHTLDGVLGARGVGLDVSVAAAKHLAKCHPRVGAVVADAWARLPLRDKSIDAISVIFAPRNPAEFARVLKDDGQVIVLTADTGHLAELREPLGIIDVEPGKVERLIEQASAYFEVVDTPQPLAFEMQLNQGEIAAQIGMSPSARHVAPDVLEERIAKLPATMSVTAHATITRLRKR